MFNLLSRIILILLLSGVVYGQEQKVSINKFGGLNTADGDFSVKPNMARVAQNIDWGRNVGSITKRYGYDTIGTVTGLDSIIAIYGAYYSDGTQQMFIVSDESSFGFGSVYVTQIGSSATDSLMKVWDYFPVFGVPSFTMANDAVYIVNGHSEGIVYNKINDTFIVRTWPSRSPGEPLIVPLSDTGINYWDGDVPFPDTTGCTGACDSTASNSGELNGEYRYMIYTGDSLTNSTTTTTTVDTTFYYDDWQEVEPGKDRWRPGTIGDSLVITTRVDTSRTATSTLYQGKVSPPIKVVNGRVMLSEFPYPNVDTVSTAYTRDTMTYTIVRTKANSGRLTNRTEFFYIGEFKVFDSIIFWDGGTGFADTTSCTGDCDSTSVGISGKMNAFRKTFIDSIPDTLSTVRYSKTDFKLDLEKEGLDSSGAFGWRYGSPRLLSIPSYQIYSDTANPTNTDADDNFGIFNGIPKQRDTLGYSYMVTYIDTVNGIESDSGRTCNIWIDKDSTSAGKKPFSYQITIPQPKLDDSGIVINLYRGLIEQITYDSSYYDIRYGRYTFKDTVRYYPIDFGWVDVLAVDTVRTLDYFLLGQVSVGDTLYTDSIRQDSLDGKRRFSKSTPPALMSKVFTYDGRIYAVQRSRLYRSGLVNSLVDTLQRWGQMDFQAINESDGDIGTVAFPTRTSIRFMKNFSTWNVYSDFGKREISGYLGCIAPHSYQAGLGGHYYLSDAGVIRETEGTDLERLNNFGLISKPLDNFDKLDIVTKSKARSFYANQKYVLSIGDTTYVYDEKANAWSTWSLKIGAATLYGTETNINFIPGDTVYFVKPGESIINRYGTANKDNTSTISWSWKGVPLLVDGNDKNITAIGLWSNSISTADSTGVIIIQNEEGTLQKTVYYNNISRRYIEKAVVTNLFKYSSLIVGGATSDTNLVVVDGIDVFYINQGKTERE